MDNINSNIAKLNLSHLVINCIAISLICVGLIGHDIFLKTANYGPLIIISFGVFVQSLSFEINHKLSKKIDSNVFYFLEISEKETRWMNVLITFILLFFGIISFLLSIHGVSASSTSLFALSLVSMSILLGVSFGRIITSTKGIQKSLFTSTDNPDSKKEEHKDLTNFLLQKGNPSKINKFRLDEQSDLISYEMRKLIDTNNNQLYDSLNGLFLINPDQKSKVNRNFPQIINKLLSENFSSTKVLQEWARGSLNAYYEMSNNPQSRRCYSILSSYLMFNPLKSLTEHLYSVRSNDSGHHALADNILWLLGEVASRIDNENLFSSGSTSHRINVDNLPEEDQSYLQFFMHKLGSYSLILGENNRFSWTPWWLINIRIRYLALYHHTDSKKWRLGSIQHKNYKDLDFIQLCENVFGVISMMLSESEVYPDDSSSLNSKIRHKYSSLNQSQKIPTIFLNDLMESIDDNRGSSTDSLIKMAWVLQNTIYRSIKQ